MHFSNIGNKNKTEVKTKLEGPPLGIASAVLVLVTVYNV